MRVISGKIRTWGVRVKFLDLLATGIDTLNEYIGRGAAWVALLMVLVQFAVVIMRYVFSIGFIPMQESIWYMHGILFMFGAGYTLLHDGHVRVDIFYREASARRKALVDMVGALVFLIPLMALTMWLSWSYVINSWKTLEGSTEISGLPLIFLYKTVIWVFAILLGLQAISMAIRGLQTLLGDETHLKTSGD